MSVMCIYVYVYANLYRLSRLYTRRSPCLLAAYVILMSAAERAGQS